MLEDVKRERERCALSSHLSLLSQISPLGIISLLLLSSWNEGNAILGGESWPARGHPRSPDPCRGYYFTYSQANYTGLGHTGCLSLSPSLSPILKWRSGKFGGPTYSWRILTVPNSLVVMVPSPSLSNRENASLNSAICSSVSWSAYK